MWISNRPPLPDRNYKTIYIFYDAFRFFCTFFLLHLSWYINIQFHIPIVVYGYSNFFYLSYFLLFFQLLYITHIKRILESTNSTYMHILLLYFDLKLLQRIVNLRFFQNKYFSFFKYYFLLWFIQTQTSKILKHNIVIIIIWITRILISCPFNALILLQSSFFFFYSSCKDKGIN